MSEIKQLTFTHPFDAIICLQANLPDRDFFALFKDLPLLAADGAAANLINIGIIPDYIIGDLDSFDKTKFDIKFKNTQIIRIEDQETNDFEKNLKFAIENNYKSILILGFHGGDLEHTFNNWSVLIKYAAKLNLCICDKSRYGIPVSQSFLLKCNVGEMISLIPQPSANLKTTGLKWELHSESLTLGLREGARNVAVQNEVTIEIEEGSLTVFLDSRLPYAPSYL